MRLKCSSTWLLTALSLLGLLGVALAAPPDGKGGGKGGGGGGGSLPANPNFAYIEDSQGYSIRLLDTLSGADGVLVPGAEAFDLTWSPDGSEIAYVRLGTGEIRIAATNGSGEHVLVPNDSDLRWRLDWSDGPTINGREMILFGNGTLYAIAPDGTELTEIATGVTSPRWSPAGDQFLAYRNSADAGYRLVLFTLGLVDGALTVIDEQPFLGLPGHPYGLSLPGGFDWSDDGQWVVSVQYDAPTSFGGDVWVFGVADPTVHFVLTNSPDEPEESPALSANGSRVYYVAPVYHRGRVRGHRLVSIDLAGNGGIRAESASDRVSEGRLRPGF